MKKKEYKDLVLQQAETIRRLKEENDRLSMIFTNTRLFLETEVQRLTKND